MQTGCPALIPRSVSLMSCVLVIRMGIKAPGKLLLLVATAAIALQHGAATTSSSTPFASLDCGPEVRTCVEDTVCGECATAVDTDAYLDCQTTGIVSSSLCADLSKGTCCLDAASPHDCLGNDLFVAYHLCLINVVIDGLGEEECTALDCSDVDVGGVTDGTDDGGDTTGYDDDTDDGADDGGDTAGAGASGADDYASVTSHDSVTSLTDADGQCSVESQACSDDEGCVECSNAVLAGDEWWECWEQYELDESDVCSFHTKSICCADAISANDCAGNTAFVELNLCVSSEVSLSVGQGECTTFTCSGDGVIGDTEDGADASGADASGAAGVGRSPSIAVLTLVWCIFVLF